MKSSAYENKALPQNDKKRKRIMKRKKECEDVKVKIDYKAKYIGETSKSAYERGREHVNTFRDLNETSHMLKHALIDHEGMEFKDIEFGMRVTQSYRSAIERQIGEAVKIEREYRRRKKLLNSKGEFNRREIPRLTAGTENELLKELQKDEEEKRSVKMKIKMIRKRKKDRLIQEEMSNPSLRRVCLEILNEDNRAWEVKKRKIEKEKQKREEEGSKEMERIKRVTKAEEMKKEFDKKRGREGELKFTEKEKREIERRKSFWRNYQEKRKKRKKTQR